MPIESVIDYASRIRELRRAGPSNLELALAPAFQRLVESLLPEICPNPPVVVPEFATPGIGRPDIALKRPSQPARAFIELKSPEKPGDPSRYRDPHDRRQFQRFQSLPVWAISNFASLRVFRLAEPIAAIEIVPEAAIEPTTSDARAEKLIRAASSGALLPALTPLALTEPPPARNAKELAANLAHSARLVRAIVEDRLAELSEAGTVNSPLQIVRDEFRETLYAHPKAGGYEERRFEPLFAAAFAQTFVFGLLLAREASGGPVDYDAWRHMPNEHALMRATLRVLSQEEIVRDVGVGFDVVLDAINSFDPAILARKEAAPDPILYFYEDFLEVFNPAERERYGVYYTPVDVVSYMVAALDGALRESLGTAGLTDDSVTLLDPATGTGTFLLGVVENVRRGVENAVGPGAMPGAMRALATRLFGFELLVGPYAVAQYRLRHALGALRAEQQLGVFLADTLAEPGAAAPLGRLGFVAENISAERREADRIKRQHPIIAIIGNPPYRRLAAGEVGELVGDWMDRLWNDLKAPVRDAGWGNQLNTFPEFSVAFWRWAIWKLFESEDAPERGVVAFISNRTFLAGKPYAGLRKMLREKFDRIEIIDLRGDLRRGERAGVEGDQGVFNIQVGTAITLAIADGSKTQGALARVFYTDSWAEGLFRRDTKLSWLRGGAESGSRPGALEVQRGPLDDMKPRPFQHGNWPSLAECFEFKRAGIQTKRDAFVYSFSANEAQSKIVRFLTANDETARTTFHDSRDRSWNSARQFPFDASRIIRTAYRPLDNRFLYNHPCYVDFPRPELQSAWGANNSGFYCLTGGTGAGPAIWCYGLVPDNNSFRGSYGGYAFPLRDNRPGRSPYNLTPALLAGLAASYGAPVTPEDVFDAMLALLSASSYTLRCAEDLEDVFPHVPFPSDYALFLEAARLGREVRAVETFARPPGAAFLPQGTARVETEPSGMLDARDARKGLPVDNTTLTAVRDLVGRIGELIDLFDRADTLLARVLPATLSRDALGLGGAPQDEAGE